MRPYVLSETNYRDIKKTDYAVAVLPIGATEPHNLHLPYGTDTLTVARICELACERAWAMGARVAVLPAIPFGVNTNTLDFPMVINMNPTTQLAVIGDIVDSLERGGVRKLVLVNGHGGNELGFILRQLHGGPVFLSLINWWQVPRDQAAEILDTPGDHADEMETSVMMYLWPELVLPLAEADAGKVRPSRFEAVNRGWVKITRPWHLLTTNSGSGDPSAATTEKGARYVDLAVERIAGYLKQLADAQMDATFPFAAR